ncbi:hypothetical protein ANN_23627 [Periplaneta americana]|uniref:Reverse transcriptase domain-containing protein n=1 Tax=Periplaneta americana TaxID=6978 RepID=A0ABQ8SM27_PERAM|nr:hypothetical protein ANN_23627 [Periplaneta americana]
MAGLCEGGNEPAVSLKAICNVFRISPDRWTTMTSRCSEIGTKLLEGSMAVMATVYYKLQKNPGSLRHPRDIRRWGGISKRAGLKAELHYIHRELVWEVMSAAVHLLYFSYRLNNVLRIKSFDSYNEISNQYGFTLSNDLQNLSAFAFADDLALVGKDEKSATALIDMAESKLDELGLEINTIKSKCIILERGVLTKGALISLHGSAIHSTDDKSETIRYLGVDFRDKIFLDKKKIITNLTRDLNNLTQTPLLKPDQKLKFVNEYIWPGLIYPLQCAPLDQLPDSFLKDLDKHFKICKRLSQVSDDHLLLVRNLEEEKKTTLKRLKIPEANITPRTTGIHLRDEFRKRSFDSWCQLPHKEKGCAPFLAELSARPLAVNQAATRQKLLATCWAFVGKESYCVTTGIIESVELSPVFFGTRVGKFMKRSTVFLKTTLTEERI